MPELRERPARPLPRFAPAHETEARGLHAQDHVLRHREVRRERELLVDHLHAGAPGLQRIPGPVGGPVEGHLSPVGRQGAGEDRHERALARTVLAHERADLAGSDLQVDSVQRDGGPEGLPDAPHPEARR